MSSSLPMAENPTPSIVTAPCGWLRTMSRQRSIAGAVAAWVPGSSASRNSNARSEKTTPNPNVAPRGFCSVTRTFTCGISRRTRMAV